MLKKCLLIFLIILITIIIGYFINKNNKQKFRDSSIDSSDSKNNLIDNRNFDDDFINNTPDTNYIEFDYHISNK